VNVISVSRGIGKLLDEIPFSVIHNAYRTDDFFVTKQFAERTKSLVFVGRLIKDKGVDVLLKALAVLKESGLNADLTIVGSGPEQDSLKALAKKLSLEENVNFVGSKQGSDLREILNDHKIMAVPSNYPEAFGIVALEGIACGCVVVAADSYGLPEAVGPCGRLFEMGNHADLAAKLKELIESPELLQRFGEQREDHLGKHTAEYIADKYLSHFMNTIS
jgi:glycosyltransferase involved in cell wall biosynthesis